MNTVKDTSLDAYYDLKQLGQIQPQQFQIINVMRPGKTYTRRMLARLSKLETSTASARINSMLDTHIAVVGTMKDPLTGKTVEALALIDKKAAA
jgi:hypothetical protein